MSRIGKKPVAMPSGVSASVSGQTIEVKGPKGTRSFRATDDVTLTLQREVLALCNGSHARFHRLAAHHFELPQGTPPPHRSGPLRAASERSHWKCL